MKSPFYKIVTPPCPDCKSTNTIEGKKIRTAAGIGMAVGGSLVCYLVGFLYPMGRILIPFLFIGGIIICFIPSLGKYCCLDCDAYWNPDRPDKIWRPKPPGM